MPHCYKNCFNNNVRVQIYRQDAKHLFLNDWRLTIYKVVVYYLHFAIFSFTGSNSCRKSSDNLYHVKHIRIKVAIKTFKRDGRQSHVSKNIQKGWKTKPCLRRHGRKCRVRIADSDCGLGLGLRTRTRTTDSDCGLGL